MNRKVMSLKGIGEKTSDAFEKLGVVTVRDLLSYYPRDYETFEEPRPAGSLPSLEDGTLAAVAGYVREEPQVRRIRGMAVISARLEDETGSVEMVWFHALFMKNALIPGKYYIARGRKKRKGNTKAQQLLQPALYSPEEYSQLMGTWLPIYRLSGKITNKMIRKAVGQALSVYREVPEFYPLALRKKYELAEYNFALSNIHFPKDKETLLIARKRLVFDEFFFFIAALRSLKESEERMRSAFPILPRQEVDEFQQSLPYALTAAQEKTWKEIRADLGKPVVMSRLVQGDVGSGKTIVAILALMEVCLNGYQGALMVPTEVLARQHLESMEELFREHHIELRPVLLTGSMSAREKREAYRQIASGEADIIVGTHALIQEKVEYHSLALVVTDEQHRFGVRQREALSGKGDHPHILVMSATPIPRTLAIILYGDLDISVIDELPGGRLPIKNCVVDSRYHPTAYQFIAREVEAGRQAYIICPMVEESEGLEAENVVDYEKKLKKALPHIQTACLHGRMKAKEKNDIMERFLSGEIQVLVSTTVVEVGVNVPNATVMMVENAERFGLAQLHQLRGRVGRGKYQSYCIFVSDTKSRDTQKRLQILNQSNDGFYIAGEDLKLRGPGDMFGVRQSGLLEFKIGDIFTDAAILQAANEAVNEICSTREGLAGEEYRLLRERLEEYKQYDFGKLNL